MRSWWSSWVEFWDRKEPATAIALFRIGIGLCVVTSLFELVGLDLATGIWVGQEYGGYRNFTGLPWLIELLGGPTPFVINGLLWVTIAIGVLVTAGIGGRLSVFCLLQAYLSLTDMNTHAGGSYDELLLNGLWILVLAPATGTLSVDCWRRTGRWHDETPMLAFGRYLIIAQLFIMYWTTGLQKVSAFWVPGGDSSALYYILQQPSWHRGDMGWLASYFFITQIGTLVSWFWEISVPIWLLALWYDSTPERGGRLRYWFRRLKVKWVYLIVGITFHVSVYILMNIGPFSLVSVCFYVALIRPREWERVRLNTLELMRLAR